MSTSKRIISLILALVMVLGMPPWDTLGAEAAGFTETTLVSEKSAESSGNLLSQKSENSTAATSTKAKAQGTTVEVTRAQWIQMLVETFSMVVEEDN